MKEPSEPSEPLVDRLNDHLQQQVQGLDHETERQLNRMRAEAVAIAEGGSQRSWFANAGYAAAFSVAVIAGMLLLNSQPAETLQSPSSLEMVLLNEDFDLLEEDLAFYRWAEAEMDNTPKG